MNFVLKKVPLGNKLISVFIPKTVPENLWFAEPVVSSRAILGNAKGLTFLAELLLIAVKNKISNAIFYIPRPCQNEQTPMLAIKEIRSWYNIGKYDLDLVLFNYHSLQIRPKDVKRVINSLSYLPGEEINLESDLSLLTSYLDTCNHRKLRNRLNSKSYSKYLVVTGNRDILLHLAYLAYKYRDVKDNEEYNFIWHSHADSIGTSTDNGLDYYYYFEPSLNSNNDDVKSKGITPVPYGEDTLFY